MKRINYLLICLLSVFLLSFCTKKGEPVYQEGEGGVNIFVTTQENTTKADIVEGSLNPQDFKVELINSSNVIFKRWKTFAEYLAEENQTILIKSNQDYTVRACWGDSTAVGWDKWFFLGETTFKVAQGETKNVDVTCKLGNVKVAVKYADVMASEYTSYHATVKHKRTRDSLEFKGEHAAEAGYIRPGDLMLYLYVTDLEGVSQRFGTKIPYYALKGDFVTFNVSREPTPTEEIKFNVTIDSSTSDKEINIPIGAYMLAADAPKIIPEGFDLTSGKLTYVEGVKQSAKLNLNTAGGLASCKMKVNSPYISSVFQDFPSEIDFFNISENDKNMMEMCGIKSVGIEAGATLSQIDLSDFSEMLKYNSGLSSNESLFTIEIVDASPTSKSLTASFSLDVNKANVAINNIEDVDVWSVSAPVTLVTDNGNPKYLAPQVRVEGGSWVTPTYTSSISGNTATFNMTGLAPGKNYQVRGTYNNNISEEKSMVTETQVQMGNSGFEDFYYTATEHTVSTIFVKTTGTQYLFYPYADGEQDIWWNTNNPETAPTPSEAGYFYMKCFPAVTYTVNGTYNNSAKSAEIRSIATKNGNSEWVTEGKRAGRLFCDKHSFPSRPTKLQYQYKYDPYNNDTYKVVVELRNGDSVIATKEVTGGKADDWTTGEIVLDYSELRKKATSISVTFFSSVNDEPDTRNNATLTLYVDGKNLEFKGGGTWNTNSNGVNYGSCLTIDDVKLIYEK